MKKLTERDKIVDYEKEKKTFSGKILADAETTHISDQKYI